MLNLSMGDITIFRQVLKYIDEQYIPDDAVFTSKFEMLSNNKPIDENECIYDIFEIRKINWNTGEKADRRNLFCENILTYLDNDLGRLWACCKKAHLSKTAFERICEKTFSLGKVGVCNLIIAAKLDFARAIQLFKSAGFQLYQNNKFDVVMSFFFEKEIYDFSVINKTLYLLDIPMLGYSFV